jgi:DNA-binding XRE family transcriptional regulator
MAQRRFALGMTQAYLASEVGAHRVTIWRYEHDLTRKPDLNLCKRIAVRLGTPLLEVFPGIG